MSVVLIAEVKIKQGTKEELVSYMREILPDTRAFEGNEGIDVCFDEEDSDLMVLVEKWSTPDDYHKYHEWRVSSGTLDKLRSFLAGKPSRRFLDIADC